MLFRSILADQIRLKFPEFQPSAHGSTNLRSFLQNHIPDVVPLGRKGMDNLYGLKSTASEAAIAPTSFSNKPQDQLSIWKTISSPNSPFKLFAKRDDGNLIVCPPGISPPEGYEQVNPVSEEKNRGIAQEYINSLSDETQRAELLRTFDSPLWWIPFYQTTRKYKILWNWMNMRRIKSAKQLGSLRFI